MSQINLLGDAGAGRASFMRLPRILLQILIFIFVAMIVYWAFLTVRTKMGIGSVVKIREAIVRTQEQALKSPERQNLLARQGQLSAANTLIAGHRYWSKFLPELARVTLKTASYIAISADDQGRAHFTISVPSYKDFDQFLQVFDLPDFQQNIGHVSVTAVGKYQQSEKQLVRFDVDVKYKEEFLQGAPTEKTPPAGVLNSQTN